MPSPKGSAKYIAVRKRAQKKYKQSEKGQIRIRAAMSVWRETEKGKVSRTISDKKWGQTVEYKTGQAARMKIRRAKRKQWLRDIKSKLSCQECGYDKHPAALQFHHLGDKIDGITKLVCNTSKSYEFIRKEMVKCIVLCANCHLILHDEEYNDRVRARDTTRGRLPNLGGNKASPNHNALRVKGKALDLERTVCDGKQHVDNKHDHKRSHTTLC